MVFGRNVEQDKQMCRVQKVTILPFSYLAISPFVIFDSDYALIWTSVVVVFFFKKTFSSSFQEPYI